jgi:hypothetical protein
MKPIIWIEQDNLFGLNHSSKQGLFHDYNFDIRYDYDGDPKIKPNDCGLNLTIIKSGVKVESKLGKTIKSLVKYSELFLEKEKEKFL